MTSLFIVALPRSMSTLTFRVSRDALGLRPPAWSANGEILNHDLHVLSRWPKLADEARKYVTREGDSRGFEAASALLETATRDEGFIYKDVVNPFVIHEWKGLARFRVLKIERDVSEVAHAMLRRGWHYPAAACAAGTSARKALGGRVVESRIWQSGVRRAVKKDAYGKASARLVRDTVIRGLDPGECALAGMPGEAVAYSDLLTDGTRLHDALSRLYPGVDIPAPDYIDDAFVRLRDERARVRDTASFARVAARVARFEQAHEGSFRPARSQPSRRRQRGCGLDDPGAQRPERSIVAFMGGAALRRSESLLRNVH